MVRGSERTMVDTLQRRGITVVIPATKEGLYFACARGVSAESCVNVCTLWRRNHTAWVPPCVVDGTPLCSVLPLGLPAPRDGLDRMSRATGLPRAVLQCPGMARDTYRASRTTLSRGLARAGMMDRVTRRHQLDS